MAGQQRKFAFHVDTYFPTILYSGPAFTFLLLVYDPILIPFYVVIKIEVKLPSGQGN